MKGHKCLYKFLLLMKGEDDDDHDPGPIITELEDEVVENADILLLNSLIGHVHFNYGAKLVLTRYMF